MATSTTTDVAGVSADDVYGPATGSDTKADAASSAATTTTDTADAAAGQPATADVQTDADPSVESDVETDRDAAKRLRFAFWSGLLLSVVMLVSLALPWKISVLHADTTVHMQTPEGQIMTWTPTQDATAVEGFSGVENALAMVLAGAACGLLVAATGRTQSTKLAVVSVIACGFAWSRWHNVDGYLQSYVSGPHAGRMQGAGVAVATITLALLTAVVLGAAVHLLLPRYRAWKQKRERAKANGEIPTTAGGHVARGVNAFAAAMSAFAGAIDPDQHQSHQTPAGQNQQSTNNGGQQSGS